MAPSHEEGPEHRMIRMSSPVAQMEQYGDYVQDIAPSSAECTIKTNKVPKGKVFRSLTICAFDRDNAIATSIEFGILSGEAKKPIDITPGSFVAGQSHTIRFPCILGPGQRIYATFLTPTAGDRLVLSTHGVLMPEGAYCSEGDL